MKELRTRWKIRLLLLSCVLVFVSGCGTTTILLKQGDPVRLREDVKAKIWIADAEGNWQKSVAILPNGWYCIADPGE